MGTCESVVHRIALLLGDDWTVVKRMRGNFTYVYLRKKGVCGMMCGRSDDGVDAAFRDLLEDWFVGPHRIWNSTGLLGELVSETLAEIDLKLTLRGV